MITTDSLYQTCEDLFAQYSLAVNVIKRVPATHSMVLMLRDGENARFFGLLRDCGNGKPVYSVIPWDASGTVTVEPGGGDIPGPAANAVLRGVPIPRDGSLFGWNHGGLVAALVVVDTTDGPVPSWSTLPLAGLPQAQWPPFTGERLFGRWFWDLHQAGRITDLSHAIAGTSQHVWWVNVTNDPGSGSCAVASAVRLPGGITLPEGLFVYHEILRSGVELPSLDEALAMRSKLDLGPEFREAA